MGILDMFKRKKDDFAADPFATPGMNPAGTDPFSQQQPYDSMGMNSPLGIPEQPSMQPMQQQYPGMEPQGQQYPGQGAQGFSPEQAGYERITPQNAQFYGKSSGGSSSSELSNINMGKDLEIINAKLDAIKAELDSVNQRIKRIERLAEEPGSAHKDAWNY